MFLIFSLCLLFCFYSVYSVVLHCFVYCFSSCIQLSYSCFCTSLLTTATGWKPNCSKYEGNSEIKERFAIKKYLLIIGKKKNMQVLSHTLIYFST
jgi:hypothetical protein